MAIVDSKALLEKLEAAGIAVDGCDSTGRIDFRRNVTDTQRDLAAQIVADLSANPPTAEPTVKDELLVIKEQVAQLQKRVAGLEAGGTIKQVEGLDQ